MLKWVQSGLSVVAGTAEPEYGPDAIHPVTRSEKVWRETTGEDFAWRQPSGTNVETQTFYFSDLELGYIGFAQVIHLNVMGVKTTAQFTFRLFNNKTGLKDPLNVWTSTALEDFRAEGLNFYAKGLSIELDGSVYTIKSSVCPDLVVDLKVTRLTPGVIFGEDGLTLYGEDKANPWGLMRHVFWPRCLVVGTLDLKEDLIEINGYTMFVMALQGMKPHHAAKAWNFLNFQLPSHAAVQMEFTTPALYANTKVNIGILTSNDKIIRATVDNVVVHSDAEVDEVGWLVPKLIEFDFVEKGERYAVVKGPQKQLIERVDVMAEIPQFVKNIVSGVAGTKPFIYQFCNTMTVEHADTTEEGIGFNEVTFISE